ncbi:MAG: signal peptidase II [Clostridia bacterium]|nr:signal peptidase II [Clostridia bacterium]
MKIKDLYKKRRPAELVLYTAIIVIGIVLDQLTKLLAVKYLAPVGSVPLWQDVLHLTYVENPGAAFGMLAGAPWVFNTISIIATVAISLYLYLGHAESPLYAVALSMIVSGGIGNLIDRLSLGYVVDFIDFTLIDFAVFNGADSFVCVGAGLLILALVLDIIKEWKAGKK